MRGQNGLPLRLLTFFTIHSSCSTSRYNTCPCELALQAQVPKNIAGPDQEPGLMLVSVSRLKRLAELGCICLQNVDVADVLAELRRRFGVSGIDEKASRT